MAHHLKVRTSSTLTEIIRDRYAWGRDPIISFGDLVKWICVEIVDREGKSSLLAFVKAFDSVLAVYEGFCNLKQVDLKLKICRGSSTRKILVREAKSYSAAKIIVGATGSRSTIRSPPSVAKYCAKKLPRDCSVLAVNNGKVLFQREGSLVRDSHGAKDDRRNGLLNAIHRSFSLSKNSRVLNESGPDEALMYGEDKDDDQILEQALVKARPNSLGRIMKESCSVCGAVAKSHDNACRQSAEESYGDNGGDVKSLALVPVPKVEAPSCSFSSLIRQVPEMKPGWPLLRRAFLPDRRTSDRSSGRQISVVQWAMRLPSRQLSSYISKSDHKQNDRDQGENQSSLNGESGAIVPVGTENLTIPLSPDNSKTLPKELEGLHEKYLATCRLFNYQELVSATSNFSAGLSLLLKLKVQAILVSFFACDLLDFPFCVSENLVGKGGSSWVYKGCLPDGKELAVKILKPSEDVIKEFVLEIEIITTLHHKNIISLLGFCFENNKLLLVYDFLSRGSLEENLHGKRKDSLAFGWSERYKVAVGIAGALNYLHNETSQPVIHRDVKSSNILLSDDFDPQLSDFGLAKWTSTSSSHIICTDVAGTFGYLAPEYFMYGKVNDKIDVYAYGVVLLELLSGRKPISNEHPKGQESLVMWAKPILNDGKISKLLDPSLGNDYDHDQIERMVLAATLCVKHSPQARPQMSVVLKLLQGDAEVMKWARLQVNTAEGPDTLDDEACPRSNLQSHLSLALLDVEDDSLSMSSIEETISLEDYLLGRCSRSSSFD
uniref:Protein kinase domain-containing protein n=1 Tax=Manihot esculenta TaxID=3983 RepID=A0A2C9U2G7_MANES